MHVSGNGPSMYSGGHVGDMWEVCRGQGARGVGHCCLCSVRIPTLPHVGVVVHTIDRCINFAYLRRNHHWTQALCHLSSRYIRTNVLLPITTLTESRNAHWIECYRVCDVISEIAGDLLLPSCLWLKIRLCCGFCYQTFANEYGLEGLHGT